MNYKERLQTIKDECNKREALKNKCEEELKILVAASDKLQKDIEKTDKSKKIVSNVSLSAKKHVAKFLQDIVTDAIQYIAGSNYRFEINLDDSGKTIKCDFYIVETINGVESKQEPKDFCGGGFVDIISSALRYAYVNLFNRPKLMGWMELDEPGKMISADMSARFGEFIKKLGEDFNRQTIMVTHNENLKGVADNEITIVK